MEDTPDDTFDNQEITDLADSLEQASPEFIDDFFKNKGPLGQAITNKAGFVYSSDQPAQEPDIAYGISEHTQESLFEGGPTSAWAILQKVKLLSKNEIDCILIYTDEARTGITIPSLRAMNKPIPARGSSRALYDSQTWTIGSLAEFTANIADDITQPVKKRYFATVTAITLVITLPDYTADPTDLKFETARLYIHHEGSMGQQTAVSPYFRILEIVLLEVRLEVQLEVRWCTSGSTT